MSIHESIARDLRPVGGILRCEQCGHEEKLQNARIGGYLASGWPECCGYTMMWITQRQLDAAAGGPGGKP